MRALGLAMLVLLGAGAATASARSADVAALQVALYARGLYAGDVDGLPGPATAGAVRAFQRRERLAPDGIAGPRTPRAMGRPGRHPYGSPAPPPAPDGRARGPGAAPPCGARPRGLRGLRRVGLREARRRRPRRRRAHPLRAPVALRRPARRGGGRGCAARPRRRDRARDRAAPALRGPRPRRERRPAARA